MIKKLEKLGDRMLTRVVPKVEAAAGVRGCEGIYCGCIAGWESWRLTNNHSCGKCRGLIC